MHWHEDLQFIYVLSGDIEIVTLDTHMTLHVGEGIFINKNVVHLVKKSKACHYNSFIFPDYFLRFYLGSPTNDAVEQLVEKNTSPVFHIENTEEHRTMLEKLKKLSVLEEQKTPLYAYEVLTLLCTLWLELCRVVNVPEAQNGNHAVKERMTIFLRYIEENYPENVSLEALAQSAHVSKSKCLRCFRLALHTTPYKHLTEYRLSKAVDLLRNTDEPISGVATLADFQQPSHFRKCFWEKTGMTPSEYRKRFCCGRAADIIS